MSLRDLAEFRKRYPLSLHDLHDSVEYGEREYERLQREWSALDERARDQDGWIRDQNVADTILFWHTFICDERELVVMLARDARIIQ